MASQEKSWKTDAQRNWEHGDLRLRAMKYVCAAGLSSLFVTFSAAAQITVTNVSIDGSPGDRIATRDYFFTPRDGTLSANALAHIVVIMFRNATQSWDLRFEAPQGQSLTNGFYTNAHRIVTAEFPSLEVTGNSRGCNQIVGGFNILNFEQPGDGTLSSLHATFSQYCDNSTVPTRGEVLFNVQVQPLVLTNLTYLATNGGTFSMEMIGTSNAIMRVQYSTNLNVTNWITTTNFSPPTGRFIYTTNGVGSRRSCIYRGVYGL